MSLLIPYQLLLKRHPNLNHLLHLVVEMVVRMEEEDVVEVEEEADIEDQENLEVELEEKGNLVEEEEEEVDLEDEVEVKVVEEEDEAPLLLQRPLLRAKANGAALATMIKKRGTKSSNRDRTHSNTNACVIPAISSSFTITQWI